MNVTRNHEITLKLKWNYITKPRLNWSTVREQVWILRPNQNIIQSGITVRAAVTFTILPMCFDSCHICVTGRSNLSFHPHLSFSLPCCTIKVVGKIKSWIMIFKFNLYTRIMVASIIILLRNSYFKKKEYLSYFISLFQYFNL